MILPKRDMKWPMTLTAARRFQEICRKRVKTSSLAREPEYVGGVDAAYSGNRVYAAACLYQLPELKIVETSYAVMKTSFPYVSGYLFLREGPAIIAAIQQLSRQPGLVLVDGQGIAHPRGIGSAANLGVLLDIPTIGCAKSKLVGAFEEPAMLRGSWSPLSYGGRVVGAVLRTKDHVKPLFISAGHKINLEDSIRLTLACVSRYRKPDPLRCADMLSRKLKQVSP